MRSAADLTPRPTSSRHQRSKRYGLRAAVIGSTILVAAAAAPLGALADSDMVAPQLTSVTVGTPALDVSYGPALLHVAVHATDDLSGVRDMQLDVFGPGNSTGQQTGDYVRGICALSSGTAMDGDWSCSATLPRWSHTGTWSIALFAADQVPNLADYTASDLAAHGWDSSFTVSGTQDVTAPQIDTVSASPTTAAPGQPVAISFIARDDMSGLGALQVDLRSPSGRWVYQLPCNPPNSTPTTAAINCSWTPPPGAEPGLWTVHVRYSDAANNVATVGHDDGSASPGFTVTGVADTSAPVLTSFSAPAAPMDLSSSPDPYISIPATFTATDEGSGLKPGWAQVDLVAPANAGIWAMNCSITAGNGAAGTYSCTARLSKYAPSGRWTFQHVWISDLAGNQVMYDTNGQGPSLTAITGGVPELDILPGTPGTPTIATGVGAAVASWSPAPVYGGQAIDSYTVTATPTTSTPQAIRAAAASPSPVTVTVPGNRTSAALPGLMAGVSYQLRVVAHNAGGSSLAATATVAAPAVQPSPTPTPTATHPTGTPTTHPTPTANHKPIWGAPKVPVAGSSPKPERGSSWGSPRKHFVTSH